MTSDEQGSPPVQVRVAGALVALQGLLGVGFAVALGVHAWSSARSDSGASVDLPVGSVLGEAAYFLVIGVALVAVGAGLLTGRRWARTPAIVTQLLLLPVVYSLVGPSRQLVLGLVTGGLVVGTLLLLISERSRGWSMGLDRPDARR